MQLEHGVKDRAIYPCRACENNLSFSQIIAIFQIFLCDVNRLGFRRR